MNRMCLPSSLLLASLLLSTYPGQAQVVASARRATPQTSQPSTARTLSLRDVLNEFKTRYGVDILYEDRVVADQVVPATAIEVAGSLEKNLANVLRPQGLRFKKVKAGVYAILEERKARKLTQTNAPLTIEKPLVASPVLLSIQQLAQPDLVVRPPADVTLTGRVLDENGAGLPGVSVVVKGTSRGTTTNADGQYQLSISDGARPVTLVFSFVGYGTKEIPAGSRTAINVQLSPDNKSLNEVVVVGYGTVKKSDLTGAVSQIKADDVKRAATTSFDQMIQGRAAGVVVTQTSAAPGGALQVRVRGTNSINGGNDPLYVVDGVPLNIDNNSNAAFNIRTASSNNGSNLNTLASINPNDIESIEILKDASATAIYGSRGANGVVLITTKRGKAGKSVVELNASYGVQQVNRRLSVLDAQQFVALNNEARANNVSGTGAPAPQPAVFDPAAIQYNTNWQDELFRDAPVQNYQLAFRGGDERTRYAVSGNYFNQQGVVKGTGTKRYATRINLDRNVNSRLKIGMNLTASRIETNQGFSDGLSSFIASALRMAPNQPVQLNGVYLNNTNPTDAVNASVDLGLNQAGVTTIQSPLYYANEVLNQRADNRLLGNFYGELTLFKGLSYRINVGADVLDSRGEYYEPTNGTIRFAGGASERISSTNLNVLIENTLNYNQTFGKHGISAVLGQTAQKNTFDRLNVRAEGLNDNTGPYAFDGDYLTTLHKFATNNSWQMLSFLGRVNYDYQGRYFLTASFRADGSSRFGENNKYGYFPAASAAWVLSKEPFMASLGVVSTLKLRAGYGQTGSQEIGLFNSLATLTTNLVVFNNTLAVGRQPARIPNPNLSWENTAQVNVGIDAGLWRDRLSLSANYYDKQTNALLYNLETPRTSGFNSVVQNIGKVSNRGWEVELNSTNLDGAFVWNTALNVSRNRNRIESLPSSNALISNNNLLREGVALGSIYGYQTNGLFQTGDNISTSAQPNALPGERRYVDVNGDNLLNADDRTVLGLRDPTMTFGMTNTFAYKGLSLSVFFQGVSGNVIYNQTRVALLSLDGRVNNLAEAADRWTPTNPNTNIPRAIQAGSRNGVYGSSVNDFFVEPGGYFRLKNVSLSYGLPPAVSRLIGVETARFYVSSDNLATWTQYTGYNPDITGGADNGPYPNTRVTTGGFVLTF